MRPVDLIEFLEELAEASAEAIMPFFRSHFSITDKALGGQFDPVTEADRAAEMVIRARITERFPDHGILGEEFGSIHLDREFVWVVDPIDGTRSFLCGMPVWGTLIGLKHRGDAVLGLMHQPYIGEKFIGDGAKAWLKSRSGTRALATRTVAALDQAVLMTTSPSLFKGQRHDAYSRVEHAVKLARYGADCYAYAMLAGGFIDLVIESGLQPYDIVALIPIIEGAGGVITDWQGGSAVNGGDIVASANHRLHDQALRLLNSES